MLLWLAVYQQKDTLYAWFTMQGSVLHGNQWFYLVVPIFWGRFVGYLGIGVWIMVTMVRVSVSYSLAPCKKAFHHRHPYSS